MGADHSRICSRCFLPTESIPGQPPGVEHDAADQRKLNFSAVPADSGPRGENKNTTGKPVV